MKKVKILSFVLGFLGLVSFPLVSNAIGKVFCLPVMGATPDQVQQNAADCQKINDVIQSVKPPVPVIVVPPQQPQPTKDSLPTLTPSDSTPAITPQVITPVPQQDQGETLPPEPNTVQVLPGDIGNINHIPVFTTSLRVGIPLDKDTVKAVQNFLVYQGLYLQVLGSNVLPDYNPQEEVDGVYGNKTALAVREFQKLNNLVPDGIFGPLTRAVAEKVLENIKSN